MLLKGRMLRAARPVNGLYSEQNLYASAFYRLRCDPSRPGEAFAVGREGQSLDSSTMAFHGSEVSAGDIYQAEAKSLLADDFCRL